ncbi:hypothetical protein PoB_002327300 [Plakobranchus ocellatus]|uniref:Uncharacterized protein n=1 Tax=Plakobranchus ocellatus TaxID=259542 RepID=A0AAV3ZPJ7_9GAST|nr:hypothetical protein PoB_002327300 [Plakobranchus ocellatus]
MKEGHSHSHGNHQLCRTLDRSCDAAPSKSGMRCNYLMMIIFSNSMTLTKKVIINEVYIGVYKSFAQVQSTRSSWRTERDTIGPQLLRVVFVRNGKRPFGMFCPNAQRWPKTGLGGGLISPRTKSSGAETKLP